ncbi:hypothetical protein SSBR45G_45390 [Bradyrhizobium sp. SSBR45G]|uniref:hypothetical protein n=1 Tax=unclassified Bradyrhizobium TaxID=2631580 RepID=UPI002342995C|nr:MULTISPECIES: hypothetical protein [unclassified Bradyrhizobium]GLH79630.1 hypothetical protein SSBR45G_45390 [Bradyrhizobium sp. SSBR45G]GLH86975.1 hypothetical protein SSBR45R_44350 [Bradyrhizobium sp. SSBR45R]
MTTPATRPELTTSSGADRRAQGAPTGLRDLFALLGDLLIDGGDSRLVLDRPWGRNPYGCPPSPVPDLVCLSSSTASPISERAYARVEMAREQLMHAAISLGVDEALDRRTEGMRCELRGHLGLADDVDIVFSPSGTDAQLHALALVRAVLGDSVTSVVVGSDQTGSGTAASARGRHFSARTASGVAVTRDAPIAGLAGEAVFLPLLDGAAMQPRRGADAAVLDTVEALMRAGRNVLLQVMDASKLGWRAPGMACLDEVARRWPGRVQVVVDACQTRLGATRLRAHLDRGHLVLMSGSKFFGGPAFSGALLVPRAVASAVRRGHAIAPGLFDYVNRSDWPLAWTDLRARSAPRANIGQWLRWEAALEEIAAYHAVPETFRRMAIRQLGEAIGSLLLLSPVLRPVATGAAAVDEAGDEFGFPTIFPFTLQRDGRLLDLGETQAVYRALQHDLGSRFSGRTAAVAARQCLIGQPVRIERDGEAPAAALRLCIGARDVTDAWCDDITAARVNLESDIDRIADVVAKTELLVSGLSSQDLRDVCHAN